jgi:ABC-type Fe3+ transport system permease subunit
VTLLGGILLVVGVVLLFVARWFGRSAKEAAASPSEQSKQAARLYRTQEVLLYVVGVSALLLGLAGLFAT